MPAIETVTSPRDIARLAGPPTASRMDEPIIRAQQPDLHLALPDPEVPDGPCRARCSLWWTDTPSREDAPGESLGCIGHYAAADDDTAASLLEAALDRLAEAGCTRAIGPMDGATWFSYRFVTNRGDRPPFFLEPWHPPAYPAQFEAAGFAPAETYVSAHVAELPADGPGPPPIDVTTRAIDRNRASDELRRIYDLVVRAFTDNLLYTPIEEDAFLALYRGVLPAVDPAFVRLAETSGGDLAGVVFCVPDHLQAERGAEVDTVIVKTLAVDPNLTGQGLGGWLTTHVQHLARSRGYTQAIHALMHAVNPSRKISRHYGDIFRRYTLFENPLADRKNG